LAHATNHVPRALIGEFLDSTAAIQLVLTGPSKAFSQLLEIVPRHEFCTLAKQHHREQKSCKISGWDQFVALVMAQLSGRQSLRDIEAKMNAQQKGHYPLGVGRTCRSSPARVNEQQPYTLYQALLQKLVTHCQQHRPGQKFRFRNPLFSPDSSSRVGSTPLERQ